MTQRWGPYLASRAWGNVRESKQDKAWETFPFAQSRSRVYRWTEDGIGGFCDDGQRLCMALALWNGQDPILKERFFGLSNNQGNHGEDLKDYFFYVDGLPDYTYLKMLYKYPQVEFPYDRLIHENSIRGPEEPAFELINALPNTFAQNCYFDIFIEYAKANEDDILCRITAVNRGSQPAPLHLLPHLWFRNTWQQGGKRPELRAKGKKSVHVHHPELGDYHWSIEAPKALLFTENETNTSLISDDDAGYAKDGIDYAVVRGQTERVNPSGSGTKCAAHCFAMIEPGETWVVRTRLRPSSSRKPFEDFEAIFEQRIKETDAFYAALQRPELLPEERKIQRTAFAGLNWNKTFYHFNVKQWFDENPDIDKNKNPHKDWLHFDAHDVISVADMWEFPWLAAWDLSFQIVTIALIDPAFAQAQARLLLSDRYMRDDGAIPAFEGDFTTPHPPVYAWAVWHIYQMSDRDRQFLSDTYPRLKGHFDWWLKNHQPPQSALFGGGFMGMDNISVFDRSKEVPEGWWLAQADSTGWMALFALMMLVMAVEQGQEDDAVLFLGHFLKIREALETLWDADNHFLYDVLYTAHGTPSPIKSRSMVGLVPLVAVTLLDPSTLNKLPRLREAMKHYQVGANGCYLLSALSTDKIEALLRAVFDADEFYSPYGVRSVSKIHEKQPLHYEFDGKKFDFQYEPGDSLSKMFGGNSNWRGPIWAPLNHLIIEALHYYHAFWGDQIKLNNEMTLEQGAIDLVNRLVRLFKRDQQGKRPFFGKNEYMQTHWQDYYWFYEHFHGDTGEGLGASHQNGWTALIAKLIHDEGRAIYIPKPVI